MMAQVRENSSFLDFSRRPLLSLSNEIHNYSFFLERLKNIRVELRV